MGYRNGKRIIRAQKMCPILALFGVPDSDCGYSKSLNDPSRNWIKEICIEKCPLPDCLEGYSNKEDTKKLCLSRAEIVDLMNGIIKLAKEKYEYQGR